VLKGVFRLKGSGGNDRKIEKTVYEEVCNLAPSRNIGGIKSRKGRCAGPVLYIGG